MCQDLKTGDRIESLNTGRTYTVFFAEDRGWALVPDGGFTCSSSKSQLEFYPTLAERLAVFPSTWKSLLRSM